jgi:hypothetical protein
MIKQKNIAILLFLTGLLYMADWIIFCNIYGSSRPSGTHQHFISSYVSRFPRPFNTMTTGGLRILTALVFLLFSYAGYTFIRLGKNIWVAIGIFSCVMAFWQLFSLL